MNLLNFFSSLFPSIIPSSFKMGVYYASKGKFEKAILKLNNATQEEKTLPSFYYYRGYINYKLGKLINGINDYKKSLELNFDYFDQKYDDNFIKKCKEYFQNNLVDLNNEIKLNPNSDLYFKRGFIKLLTNKTHNGSLNDFNKSIQLETNDYRPYFYRSFLIKDFELKVSDLTNAIKLGKKDSKTYFLRGKAYRLINGMLKESIADYDKAIELNNNCAEYYHYRASAKVFLNKTDALKDINRAIALEPNNGNFYNSRAVIIHESQGNFRKAKLDYKKAIKLGQEHAIYGLNNLIEKEKTSTNIS